MNSIQMVINNEVHEVSIKEYQGQRVVTLKDVDTLHRRPSGTARRTFKASSKYLIEGEDYFVRNTYEALMDHNIKAPNGLILLTESGYLLIVKTFTDELAWTVQRQLVKTYFKAKEHFTPKQVEVVPVSSQMPTTIEDILMLAIGNMKEMKNVMAQQSEQLNNLRLVVDNEVVLTKQQRADIQQAVCDRQGELNREGYNSAHFQGIYRTLKTHFNVPNYSEIKRSDFEKAMKIISGWYPKKNEGNGA